MLEEPRTILYHAAPMLMVKGVEKQKPNKGRSAKAGTALPKLTPSGCLVKSLPSPMFRYIFPILSTTNQDEAWQADHEVVMLVVCQSGEGRPLVRSMKEVTVQMSTDETFIFPITEPDERNRNTLPEIVPQISDSAEGPDEDEPSDPNKRNAFDVPPMESEKENVDTKNESKTAVNPGGMSSETDGTLSLSPAAPVKKNKELPYVDSTVGRG